MPYPVINPTVLKSLKHAMQLLGVDSIIHNRTTNIVTVRRGFFYTHGQSHLDFRKRIDKAIKDAKLSLVLETVGSGQVDKPFRGGASVANSSHWWVQIVSI